jgi:hypothetical protein
VINFSQSAESRTQDYYLKLGDLFSDMGSRRLKLVEQQDLLLNNPMKIFDESIVEITVS